MKKILIILFCFIYSFVNGQINPGNGTVSNKSYSPAQAVPTDFRSQFYDLVNFVMRDYQSTAEVLSYLNLSKYRSGHFYIYIHNGGVLNGNGTYTGGTTDLYMFKDGVADGDLVFMQGLAVTASNGLNLVGSDVRLGGTVAGTVKVQKTGASGNIIFEGNNGPDSSGFYTTNSGNTAFAFYHRRTGSDNVNVYSTIQGGRSRLDMITKNSSNDTSGMIILQHDLIDFQQTYGKYRFSSLLSLSDTTTYKPWGVDASGNVGRMNYWPGGGAGGGSLTNAGAGYRVLITNGTQARTVFASNTIGWDSTSNANGLTAKADTSVLATQYDLSLISGSSALTSTYVGYGNGSNLLTGEAAYNYDAVNNLVKAGRYYTNDTISHSKFIIQPLDTATANMGIWQYNYWVNPDYPTTPNSVISIGHNWDNSKSYRGYIRDGWESAFEPFAGANYLQVERHVGEYRMQGGAINGQIIRPWSLVARFTGGVRSSALMQYAGQYNFFGDNDSLQVGFSGGIATFNQAAGGGVVLKHFGDPTSYLSLQIDTVSKVGVINSAVLNGLNISSPLTNFSGNISSTNSYGANLKLKGQVVIEAGAQVDFKFAPANATTYGQGWKANTNYGSMGINSPNLFGRVASTEGIEFLLDARAVTATLRIGTTNTSGTEVFTSVGANGRWAIGTSTQYPVSWLNIAAGTTAGAQINLASSTAPTSPVDGDIWYDGTDLLWRKTTSQKVTTETNSQTFTNKTWNGATVTVPYGGTGIATTTAYGLIAGGTTSTGNFQNVGAGTTAQRLKGNAVGLPTWVDTIPLSEFVENTTNSLTFTYVTNTSATSSVELAYSRTGATIHFYGTVVVNPTAGGAWQLDMAFPIASAITSAYMVAGTGACSAFPTELMEISGDATNDRFVMKGTASNNTSRTYYIHGSQRYIAP